MKWLENRYVQLAACFILGGFIGYSFYPTKSIEERVYEETKEKYEAKIQSVLKTSQERIQSMREDQQELIKESRKYREEVSRRISSLTKENTKLKQSVKKKRFKLVKPDGTIVEREFEESDTEKTSSVVTSIREEFNSKISKIENRWKEAYTKRIKELQEKFKKDLEKKETKIVYKDRVVEKEKIVKVNEKKFRFDVGVTTEKEIYTHTSYPLWGPFVVGAGVSADYNEWNLGDARIGIGIAL